MTKQMQEAPDVHPGLPDRGDLPNLRFVNQAFVIRHCTAVGGDNIPVCTLW